MIFVGYRYGTSTVLYGTPNPTQSPIHAGRYACCSEGVLSFSFFNSCCLPWICTVQYNTFHVLILLLEYGVLYEFLRGYSTVQYCTSTSLGGRLLVLCFRMLVLCFSDARVRPRFSMSFVPVNYQILDRISCPMLVLLPTGWCL